MSLWQGEWFIWFIIASVPFQVYDLYKTENRKWYDFILPSFMVILSLFYAYSRFFGDYEPHRLSTPGGMLIIYLFGGLAYIAVLQDAVKEKTMYYYLKVALFTIAIIAYIICYFTFQ